MQIVLVAAIYVSFIGASLADDDPRPCLAPTGNVTDFRSQCSRCSAGQGIAMYCSQVRNGIAGSWCFKDALCADCIPGRYQDKQSHTEQCSVCSSCDKQKGLTVVAECTRTSNTVCGCALVGFYFNRTLDKCTRCSVCPPGSQPTLCRGESDSTCKACTNGTFSDGYGRCRECRKCGVDQRVASVCTAQRDTVCEFYENEAVDGEAAKNNLMIYLSCGLMGLVVFSVVFYALWKHRGQSMEKKRAAASQFQRAQLYVYTTVDEKPTPASNTKKPKAKVKSTSTSTSTTNSNSTAVKVEMPDADRRPAAGGDGNGNGNGNGNAPFQVQIDSPDACSY